jgi:hypothetical protein
MEGEKKGSSRVFVLFVVFGIEHIKGTKSKWHGEVGPVLLDSVEAVCRLEKRDHYRLLVLFCGMLCCVRCEVLSSRCQRYCSARVREMYIF